MAKAASTLDYRLLARRRLPHFLFEYIDGGAYAEVTLKRNVEELQAIALRQRILVDVASLDLETRLFGERLAMPVVLAPVGLAGLNARRGEVQAVRAAQAAGINLCLSTVSVCSLAEVAGAAERPIWFQLYMTRDRGFVADLLAGASALGCNALLLTVDLPVPGSRYRDARSGLNDPPGLAARARRLLQVLKHPHWAWDVGVKGRPHQLGNLAPLLGEASPLEDFFSWVGANFDASVTWRDLDFIRAHWDGPLVIKGILDPEDAREAVAVGADGLVVSNHGGRQLDGVPSTTRALPAIAEAVGDRLVVMVDGGVRTGLDVVRMLALGARAVLLGRAWAFALGARGEAGVAHMLKLVEAEMRVAMALTGCRTVDEISAEILVR